MGGPLALLAAPGVASVVGSIGSTLLGGLFGKKKEQQTQRLDLGQMVSDARANGFNPLTVLQATGGQGWSTQASSSDLDFGAMAAAAVVEGFGDYWSQSKERELMDAQIDLTRAQAATLNNDTFGIPKGTIAPGGAIAPRQTGPINGPAVRDVSTPPSNVAPYAMTGLEQPVLLQDVQTESVDYRTKEEALKNAYRWRLPPPMMSTAHVEEMHGDVIGAGYGAGTIPVAAGYTLGTQLRDFSDSQRGQGPVYEMGGETFQMMKDPRPRKDGTPTPSGRKRRTNPPYKPTVYDWPRYQGSQSRKQRKFQ